MRSTARPAISVPTKIPSHTAEVVPLQKDLRPLLGRRWPDASEKDIDWLTADLAGLCEVSRWHIELNRELLKTDPIRNINKIQDISQRLDVNWSNARGHLETLAGELARFKRSLYAEGTKKSPRRSR